MGSIVGYIFNQEPYKLYVIREWDDVIIPTRATPKSAGLDIYSPIKDVVPAHGKLLVNTKLRMYLPQGTYGRLAPKSNLANNHFIDVGAGVIDADYQGTIYVLLYNHGHRPYRIEEGEAIAQLILENITYPVIEEVTSFPGSTNRGTRGIGTLQNDFLS